MNSGMALGISKEDLAQMLSASATVKRPAGKRLLELFQGLPLTAPALACGIALLISASLLVSRAQKYRRRWLEDRRRSLMISPTNVDLAHRTVSRTSYACLPDEVVHVDSLIEPLN